MGVTGRRSTFVVLMGRGSQIPNPHGTGLKCCDCVHAILEPLAPSWPRNLSRVFFRPILGLRPLLHGGAENVLFLGVRGTWPRPVRKFAGVHSSNCNKLAGLVKNVVQRAPLVASPLLCTPSSTVQVY